MSASKAKEDAVEALGFGFSYPESGALLSDMSFRLEEGSFTLLVGATGSGKTTLLRSIKPELAPAGKREGSIRVFGRDTGSLRPYESAALVGYVSQSPENQIVCDTVWHELAFGLENLGVAPDAMRRRVAEAAYFFGIEPWMHASTSSLSGGQKQAVTLASVLVMQPRLLLLDEPTAQLDPVAEKNFLHALFRINRELGITVLVATHAPETMADYATGALRIAEGRIGPVGLDAFDYAKMPDGPDYATGLEARPPSRHASRQGQPALSLRDVFFRYAQDAPWVLRGIDLDVAPASIHAVIGGNGSGKSTLLQTAAGVCRPQRGQAKNGISSSQALLPQDPKALFVCDSVEEELREWQKRCGYAEEELEGMIERLGLAAVRGQHPYDLSGGQQQNLALAKLLLTKPSLLLLDEPTKGLDAASKCRIAETLLGLRDEGTTIVLATHDLAFVSQVADSATMIFDGQTACTEPVADFFTHNIFYRPHADGFLRRWQGRPGLTPEDGHGGAGNAPGGDIRDSRPRGQGLKGDEGTEEAKGGTS